jgi:hypothetical protein
MHTAPVCALHFAMPPNSVALVTHSGEYTLLKVLRWEVGSRPWNYLHWSKCGKHISLVSGHCAMILPLNSTSSFPEIQTERYCYRPEGQLYRSLTMKRKKAIDVLCQITHVESARPGVHSDKGKCRRFPSGTQRCLTQARNDWNEGTQAQRCACVARLMQTL